MKRRKMALIGVFIFQALLLMILFPCLIGATDSAQAAGKDMVGGYIGAALAVGLACVGSGYAVSRIGSAAIGAVTEKPELMGKTLVFLGLAEGIAIYGLIIAVMMLNKF